MSDAEILAVLSNPLALAPLITSLVSLVKRPIENLIPATHPWHDLLFVSLPLALGVLAGLVAGLADAHPTALTVVLALLRSGAGGVLALGTYAVTTKLRSTGG